MLSKINRIKDKKLFPQILKRGRKFYCPFFMVIVDPVKPVDPVNPVDPAAGKAKVSAPVVGLVSSSASSTPSVSTPTSAPISNSMPSPQFPEFGFITSKKVGGAVERNRIRRLLSEIIIKEIPLLKPNTRAIIIAHNRSTTQSFEKLKNEVKTVFSKAGLYV